MMTVTFNGQTHALMYRMTVRDMLEHMGLAGKRVAVERNGRVVPRAEHGEILLFDGDRLEVIAAVGGG
ncbi:sulfur carrier protein ThiS [Thauera humireducens]|jgi:sulfur carrier protein|uniref:Thiamine biosynthesis protein ThiS n=1 Tax=Thauera humireducens TaxID=1134435 RepID=A0A127KB40_9RHOO|nr:sulfur carrier protein ThiS [Thauera humireducens]AMO39179.1 thiamine biosynthesis protein ThiS [Thauera humireducens]